MFKFVMKKDYRLFVFIAKCSVRFVAVVCDLIFCLLQSVPPTCTGIVLLLEPDPKPIVPSHWCRFSIVVMRTLTIQLSEPTCVGKDVFKSELFPILTTTTQNPNYRYFNGCNMFKTCTHTIPVRISSDLFGVVTLFVNVLFPT
jgi:hypothetical protein